MVMSLDEVINESERFYKSNQGTIDTVAGFIPLVGQGIAMRDSYDAAMAGDYLEAAINLTPIPKPVTKIISPYIGYASKALRDRSVRLYNRLLGKGHSPEKAADLVYKKTNVDVHAPLDRNKEVEITISKSAPPSDRVSPASAHIQLGKGAEAHDRRSLRNTGVTTDDSIGGQAQLERGDGHDLLSFKTGHFNEATVNHEVSHTQVKGGASTDPKYMAAAIRAKAEVAKAKSSGSPALIQKALERRVKVLNGFKKNEEKYWKDTGEVTARASSANKDIRTSVREGVVRREKIQVLDDIDTSLRAARGELAGHVWHSSIRVGGVYKLPPPRLREQGTVRVASSNGSGTVPPHNGGLAMRNMVEEHTDRVIDDAVGGLYRAVKANRGRPIAINSLDKLSAMTKKAGLSALKRLDTLGLTEAQRKEAAVVVRANIAERLTRYRTFTIKGGK